MTQDENVFRPKGASRRIWIFVKISRNKSLDGSIGKVDSFFCFTTEQNRKNKQNVNRLILTKKILRLIFRMTGEEVENDRIAGG